MQITCRVVLDLFPSSERGRELSSPHRGPPRDPVVGARFPAQVALAMVKDPLCLLSQDRPKNCKRIVTGRLFGGKMLCLAEVLYYVGMVFMFFSFSLSIFFCQHR